MMKINKLHKILAMTIFGFVAHNATADSLLIKNAKVHTQANQGVLENADIYIEDGLIRQVANGISQSADKVVDAKGKVVTPGLFALGNQIGLVEIHALDQTGDMSADDENAGASFAIEKAFNADSTVVAHNRAGGVTRSLIKPHNETNIFAGKGAIVSLDGDFDALIRSDVAIFAVFGERSGDFSGGSRANALHKMTQAFEQAREFSENEEAVRSGEYRQLDYSIDDLVALQKLLKRDIPLVVETNRRADILAMLDLAKSQNIRLILSGAAEAWRAAKEIAAAEVAVMVDPMDNIPNSFESLGQRYENAALLMKAGVDVMFLGQGFQPTHNAYTVRHSAGNAVAYGAPYDKALMAMTLTPARYFGGINYGKVSAGYQAELVIWDGDPLEVTTLAEQVIIDGKLTDMTTRAQRLRDRYKDISNNKNTYYIK